MASQVPVTVRTPPTAAGSASLRGKKRPVSPAVSAAPQAAGGGVGSAGSKKKKAPLAATQATTQTQVPEVETVVEVKSVTSTEGGHTTTTTTTTNTPTATTSSCSSSSSATTPTTTTSTTTTTTEPSAKPPPFKDATFMHSGIGGAAAGKKNRTWKNLKQILALERTLPWKLNDPAYFNIDAPPSLKPAKKYSDISGLPANYTDPQTKLRFTSSEEFAYIRLLPTDVVTGYLALRKATCIVP